MVRALVFLAVAWLTLGAIGCGGGSYDKPPEMPSRPSADASQQELEQYEQAYAAYQEDSADYYAYWDGHERGFATGKRKTCDAVGAALGGASISRERHELDRYQESLPSETPRDKGFVAGFAEAREAVVKLAEDETTTYFQFGLYCG